MPREAYDAFVARAKGSPDVVGLVLIGSRAADAYVVERSGHDLVVVFERLWSHGEHRTARRWKRGR